MVYELMIVVNPRGEIDSVLSKVEKSLKDASATAVKVEKLGKKMLSYPIDGQTEGEYVVIKFEAGGEAVGAISKILRLEQEAILRYLIIKVAKVPPHFAKASRGKQVSKEIETEEKGKVVVKTVTGKAAKLAKVSKVPKVSKVREKKG